MSRASPSPVCPVRVEVCAALCAGKLGEWTQGQTQLYCISNLVESGVDTTDEFVVITMSLPVLNNAPEAALELLHLSMAHPHWDEAAVNLAKQSVISTFKSEPTDLKKGHKGFHRASEKSLEDASEIRLASAMVGADHRLMDPTPLEVEALTLDGMKRMVLQMLNTQNMEVTFVGDFDLEKMQEAALKYLGTLQRPVIKADYLETEKDVEFCTDIGDKRHQVWHLQDSDERAVGYICGPAPAYWGPFGSTQWPPKKPKKVNKQHPDLVKILCLVDCATIGGSRRRQCQSIESGFDKIDSPCASTLPLCDVGIAQGGGQFTALYNSA